MSLWAPADILFLEVRVKSSQPCAWLQRRTLGIAGRSANALATGIPYCPG